MPALASAAAAAFAGVRARYAKSSATYAWASTVASGSIPCVRAQASEQTTTQEAPSFTPGALPAVVVPSGSKTGRRAASLSGVVSRRMPSSAVTSPTGTISSSKRPASCASAARIVRAVRPGVLLLPADAELASHRGRLLHHVQPVEGRLQPVVDHVVEDLAVPEPVAEAGLRQQIRRVRHRLHAARDDELVLSAADHQIRDLDRPDRRGAHLVDRVGRHLLRDARRDRRLPRRCLAGSCLEHLTHDDVADLGRVDRGALQRALRSRPPPRAVAGSAASPPPSRPNGVRTALTITERVTRPSVPTLAVTRSKPPSALRRSSRGIPSEGGIACGSS